MYNSASSTYITVVNTALFDAYFVSMVAANAAGYAWESSP